MKLIKTATVKPLKTSEIKNAWDELHRDTQSAPP